MCEPALENSIKRLGYDCLLYNKTGNDMDYDRDCLMELASILQNTNDILCVLSLNYIPIVSRACKPFRTPYLSLTADCPCTKLNSKTIEYEHNRIFLFDRLQTEKYQKYNPDNIHYLTLASDVSIWDKIEISEADHQKYDCDISFVGSLYTEKCTYNEIENVLSDYTKGYIEGIVNAQQNVYGYNFIEDSLSKDIIESFQKELNILSSNDDYYDDMSGYLADLFIGYKCTEQERINTISAISKYFNMDLYTNSDASMLPNVNYRGIADTNTEMPKIFKCSKINLNTTNRAIKSGIPLRIFDIMGCGGFVISNYQPEIPEYFIPDTDIVLYDSIGDLLEKIDFYLKNDSPREQIARNGYEKVKTLHTFDNRLQQMLTTSGII